MERDGRRLAAVAPRVMGGEGPLPRIDAVGGLPRPPRGFCHRFEVLRRQAGPRVRLVEQLERPVPVVPLQCFTTGPDGVVEYLGHPSPPRVVWVPLILALRSPCEHPFGSGYPPSMDFDLSPEQQEFRRAVREFAEEVVAP